MADVRELSTDPAVKLSGIAAVTADNAMVVSHSPNSPTPVGANLIGAVTRAGTQVDVHGQTLGVSRVVQITAKFFQQPPASFLNVTASGGATATGPTAGMAVFATSTAVTASLLAQTPVTVMYATQFEAWASMAGAFTAPTSAASFQRLGIYDAVNGYFFGYNGLNFGLTTRVSSVDTFIAKASWNVDTLTGAAGSKFTSGGTPVALVTTNLNMYRVRYGWYGGVTARFELYSPDGEWVLVHQVRTVNAQPGVNITAPDLPMTLEVSKTASDATNLIITCGGWGAGITSASSGTSLSGQGAIAALNAAVGVPLTGVGALSFSVSGTWVGTLSFQYSLDGLAWTADSVLNNVTGLFPSSVTVNGAFTATVGSYKFYRIVATAWTSGSASVVYNASPIASMVVAQAIITDGLGNGPVAVKAASTAAVAADPSMVVALSPNSPTPTGTNTIGAANFNIANVSALTVMQNAVAVTGNGVNLPVTGYGTTVIQVSGTFVANVNFEASIDAGVTWTAISATQIGFGDIFSVVTTPGTFRLTTTGMDLIRARVTWTSGTSVTVSGKSTNAINASKIVKLATGANSIGTVQLATPTAFSASSAATTNATSVKTTAGTVFLVTASNVGAAAAFLKLFNLATAPTVGTSVPFLTLPIPATGVLNISLGALGMRFGTGIAFSVTNLIADTDATVIAAAQVKVAISYL